MRGSPASARRARAQLPPAGCISAQWKGALTGSITARRAPFAFARADAFSTAASAPEITVWLGELKLAAATVRPVSASASRHASATRAGSKRGWRPWRPARRHSQLHGPAASLHGPDCIRKTQRSRGHVGRPLAERVARGKSRLNAVLRQHPPRGHADGQNRRLRVFRQPQVFVRPFEDQFGKRKPSASSASAKVCAATGKRSQSSRPMPTACDPCPEKEKRSWWTLQHGL